MDFKEITHIEMETEKDYMTKIDDQHFVDCNIVKEEYEVQELETENPWENLCILNPEFLRKPQVHEPLNSIQFNSSVLQPNSGKKRTYLCTIGGKRYEVASLIKREPEVPSPNEDETEERDEGTFHCAHCFSVFNNKHVLNAHILKHFGQPAQCYICDKTLPTLFAMEIHVKNVHIVNDKYMCSMCNTEFPKKWPGKLRTHMREKHRYRIDPYICHICGKKFMTRYRQTRHIATHKNFECQKCHRKFITQKAFNTHAKIHTEVDPMEYLGSASDLTCTICNMTFRLRTLLTMHKKTHFAEDDSLKNCLYCLKAYKTTPSLKSHMKLHHKGLPRIKEMGLACRVCHEAFESIEELVEHVEIHKLTKRFVCPRCSSKFEHRFRLTIHMRRYCSKKKKREKKDCTPNADYHKCSLCSKAYTQINALNKHMKEIHSSEKSYACKICEKRLQSKNCLKIHMKHHKTLEIDVTCPHCTLIFDNRKTFLHHMSKNHRGLPFKITAPPFKCRVCKKKFMKLDNLKKHVAIHAIEYKCEICGKYLTTEYWLKKHIRLQHKNNSDIPKCILTKNFRCVICEKTFRQLAQLRRHLKSCENKLRSLKAILPLHSSESSSGKITKLTLSEDVKEE
ncbi:zinc finger protein 791-like [Phlebotomus argentipes]|uniref:zinc finger protein 791-like n=1 Tax=Phlebotomus argentipes TaxID=94469 RepID=UPI0028937922|nr:zinc finger protein 791-like [Phlebotomus argentipes]